MRTAILILLCAFTAQLGFSQVNNAGFETWVQKTGFEDPADWQTPNSLTFNFGAKVVVKKSTDVSQGNFAALLHTQNILSYNIPGVLTNGTIGFDVGTGEVSVTAGFPFAIRFEKLTFDYKYFPGAGDSALAVAILTKKVAGNRDTIGVSLYTKSDSVKTYSSGELAINYLDPATPDTLLLLFSSSSSETAAVDGSRLWLDNIEVVYFTGERVPLSRALGLNMYPNPASFQTLVTNPYSDQRAIDVYNLQGQKVFEKKLLPGQQPMSVDQLEPGVYLFKLETRGDEKPVSGRLVVQ